MRTRVISRIAAALLVLIMLAAAGQAQTTGGIVGRVTDENGGALPGVTVQVESAVLQGSRVTTTGPDGHYRLTLLPPGDYTLLFQLAGFGPEVLVLSPPELRAAVTARLERTVADHG